MTCFSTLTGKMTSTIKHSANLQMEMFITAMTRVVKAFLLQSAKCRRYIDQFLTTVHRTEEHIPWTIDMSSNKYFKLDPIKQHARPEKRWEVSSNVRLLHENHASCYHRPPLGQLDPTQPQVLKQSLLKFLWYWIKIGTETRAKNRNTGNVNHEITHTVCMMPMSMRSLNFSLHPHTSFVAKVWKHILLKLWIISANFFQCQLISPVVLNVLISVFCSLMRLSTHLPIINIVF